MTDWPILHNLWRRHCAKDAAPNQPPANPDAEQCALQKMYVYLPAALQFLMQQQPSAEGFRAWLLEQQQRYQIPQDAASALAGSVELSAAQRQFWDDNGYLVLKAAIPKPYCQNALQAVLDCLGARLDDPTSWYRPHPLRSGLMLQFSNHPALNANRESAHIRHAYETLYGSRALYKTIDQVSFNPPISPNYHFMGSPLHWDVSLAQPIPQRFQGLLYLSDCGPKDGAFHCVPGFHHRIGDWLANLPPGADPREEAVQRLKAVPVVGEAGDFVIWHQALPHCATPNHGALPRIVQYLSYVPDDYRAQDVWI